MADDSWLSSGTFQASQANSSQITSPARQVQADLQPLDKWILSKAESTVKKVTEAFEKCQFNIAVEEIRNFTWHVFCDAYVEAVKDRLYRPEVHGEAKKAAAQYTLYEVLYRVLQMLSPVVPHLTEEIYQTMYADAKGYKSSAAVALAHIQRSNGG